MKNDFFKKHTLLLFNNLLYAYSTKLIKIRENENFKSSFVFFYLVINIYIIKNIIKFIKSSRKVKLNDNYKEEKF